ncbi:hypothetical protein TNCV_1199551 [Trichonephila clavipes]|uniref:Uncharacterized protein n=1 Tax=Trichonephila clavipes TaxID=2585209 RepID=A0A8X6V485_TRICX|nr:hypothetical protein TNCV_1199551 [Trichonephila clavipes]
MDSRRNPWRRGNIGVDIVFFEIGIEREEKKWTPEEIHGGERRKEMDSRRNPWRRGNIGVDIVFLKLELKEKKRNGLQKKPMEER